MSGAEGARPVLGRQRTGRLTFGCLPMLEVFTDTETIDLSGQTVSHFRILHRVARGGMATVYRAVDTSGGRQVALKVLHPHVAQEPKFKARFRREGEVLRNLRHPNIVPVLDYGQEGGHTYIVMPFIESGTLHERLTTGSIPLAAAGSLVSQMCSALDHAHQMGIIHRDVKPSNILIDDQGRALLSDFGFARPVETSVSLTGSAIIGTPAYMSPEQGRGDPVDSRADQYSFGIVLFEMATGSVPFRDGTPMGIVFRHVTEPMPRPRSIHPDLPPAVEVVILRALSKEAADRYPSMADLDKAFQAALAESRGAAGRSRVARRFERSTQSLPRLSRFLPRLTLDRLTMRRRVAGALLLLASLAATALIIMAVRPPSWLASGAGRNGAAPSVIATTFPPDLMSTIQALSTANAYLSGDVYSTALAGTLAALAIVPPAGLGLADASSTPTTQPPPTQASPTWTATRVSSPTRTPTPSGGAPAPTPTPQPSSSASPGPSATPTPSRTPLPPTPTPTASPTPSATPTRTRTPVPPTLTPTASPTPSATPTRTPVPPTSPPTQVPTTDPDKCKGPDHPVFPCTPTPTPQ